MLIYRGVNKHKPWRPKGGFGTICPDWTHEVGGRYRGDPHGHDWSKTVAQALLKDSIQGPDGSRFAARDGIAFKAVSSNDGTWHGYPIPWDDVSQDIQDTLIRLGQATAKHIKRQKRVDTTKLTWAVRYDD